MTLSVVRLLLRLPDPYTCSVKWNLGSTDVVLTAAAAAATAFVVAVVAAAAYVAVVAALVSAATAAAFEVATSATRVLVNLVNFDSFLCGWKDKPVPNEALSLSLLIDGVSLWNV